MEDVDPDKGTVFFKGVDPDPDIRIKITCDTIDQSWKKIFARSGFIYLKPNQKLFYEVF